MASVGVLGVVGALVASAGGAGAVPAAGSAGVPAVGESGGVKTQVFKSVSQSGTASGQISSGTLVTQIHSVGDGNVNVQVPVGTSSLRNLNGFGSVPTQGNSIVLNQQVKGSSEQRFMSTTDLQPIKVEVKATLDGKSIKPEDVVNKSGVLDVQYHIRNTTKTVQPITYKNAAGETVTENAELTQPFAGTMTVLLPSQFSEVSAPGASIAGDGENNTALNYSMVLFPPLGSAESKLSYQARVTNGSLPSVSFDFLPIKPYTNPVIASTKEKLVGAEQLGNEIYGIGDGVGAGATQLASDASELMATMTAAADSAETLADSLRDNLSVKAQRTATTAAALWAQAKGKGGMVPAAENVIDDITALNNALKNIMDTAEDVPVIASLLNLIEQMVADAHKLDALSETSSIAGESDGSTAQAANAASAACASLTDPAKTNCQTAAADVITQLESIQEVVDSKNPADPSMISWLGLANMVQKYLPMLGELTSFITSQPMYQELLSGRTTLQNEIVDNFTQTCDSCFSHLVSGSQELATKLKENAASAQEDVTTLRDGVSEGPETMISGMQELQTEGTDALHLKGTQTVDQYGAEVAKLNVLQQLAEEGQNAPYGNATGHDTTTSSVYQLTLASASPASRDNAINYLLGIVFLIVAGAVGSVAWNRRKRSA